MRKLYTFALLLALALSSAASATTPARAGGVDEKAAGAVIGSIVADFKLPDAGGHERSLSSLKGKLGTVLIFISTNCPVSNAYNDRMEKLSQEFGARGLSVVGINSNATETAADVKRHAAEKGLTFPILKDEGNKVADRLGALVTPEAYLLDPANRVVYRGRIDNSRNGDAITSSELREAIEAVLSRKSVVKTEARAFGCSIKRAS